MKSFLILMLSAVLLVGCASNGRIFSDKAANAMKSQTHDEAIKFFDEGEKSIIHSHTFYESRGDIHFHYGYYGEAVNDYTRAVRNFSKVEYHLKRGRAYMKLHFYEDAIVDFSYVIDVKGSKYPVAYVERARALVEKGDYKDAVRDLEKAKRRGADNVDFLVAMGELHYRMGKYDDAKTYIQKAILTDDKNSDLYYLRAKVFYKSKDANQTISDLKTALSLDKTNTDAKRMLAWVYATNPLETYRDGAKAVKMAKELYDVDQDVQYVEVLAASYAEIGDFDKAIETLNEGIRLSTDLVQKEDFRFDIKNYENKQNVRSW